jgi:low temperature requirement protein LtrA
VFALVWIAWINGSLHHELHGHEDVRYRSIFLLQILVLVPLGAFAGHRAPRPTPSATAQWITIHLPLTAAVAAMGAAMVSLVEHAHAPRTPTDTSWVLCGGAALVLCATMVVAASLRSWPSEPGLHRPLAVSSVAAASACLGLAAAHAAPLPLRLALGCSSASPGCLP